MTSHSDPVSSAYQDKISELERANADLAAALKAAMKRLTVYERLVERIKRTMVGV